MNNYTPRAQQTLALARKEADRFNHNHVGSEHLLLGLIKLGQGTAVNVLQKMGMDLERVRKEVEKQVGCGPETKIVGNVPYTPRVKKVLALAGKEAKALNHSYVGTEHILLGLLREGEGVAARVLKSLELDIERTRNEILKELDPKFTPSESEQEGVEPTKKDVKTPALRAFGHDLTDKARQHEFDVVCRDPDVKRVAQILTRATSNNPVLIGAPRVGKSCVIKALAESMVERRWRSAFLADRRLVQLDIPLIVAGTKYRAQMEERIKTLLTEVNRVHDVILVIDDLPSVIDDELEYAVFSQMRPGLSEGKLQCVFTAHEDEFYRAMRKCRWLESLIQPVLIESTPPDATLQILKSRRPKFEAWNQLRFTDAALKLVVELSDLYFVPRCQPANALGLLDEVGSRVRFEEDVSNPDVTAIEQDVERLRAQKEEAIKALDFEKGAALRDAEKNAKDKLDRALSDWRKQREPIEILVDETAIYRFVSERTGIEIEKIVKREQLPQSYFGSAFSGVVSGVPKFERLQTESVLQGHGIEIERGTAFVLMPHTDEFRDIFNYSIKPAMDANGILVKKAEDIYKPGSILAQVWERIRRAEIILADLTERNPNVILELGLCYGIQRCPILLVRNAEDVPFNLRNLRYIEYENTAKGSEDLKRKLTSTVAEFIAQVRTPIQEPKPLGTEVGGKRRSNSSRFQTDVEDPKGIP